MDICVGSCYAHYEGPDTERIPAFIELINQGEKLKTDWKPGNLGKKTGLFSEFSQLLSLN